MASYLSHHKNAFESKIPTNLASFEIGSHKNENKGNLYRLTTLTWLYMNQVTFNSFSSHENFTSYYFPVQSQRLKC